MTILKKTALVLAILIVIALGALNYLFGKEDYYPEQGSVDFYLKLSPVIRNTPVIAPQRAPAYYGSIGDGSKLSQSSVSYITFEKNEQMLVSTISNYLHQKQFTLDTSAGAKPTSYITSGKKVLHEITFTRAGGSEFAVLRINLLPENGGLEINVTHFE